MAFRFPDQNHGPEQPMVYSESLAVKLRSQHRLHLIQQGSGQISCDVYLTRSQCNCPRHDERSDTDTQRYSLYSRVCEPPDCSSILQSSTAHAILQMRIQLSQSALSCHPEKLRGFPNHIFKSRRQTSSSLHLRLLDEVPCFGEQRIQ